MKNLTFNKMLSPFVIFYLIWFYIYKQKWVSAGNILRMLPYGYFTYSLLSIILFYDPNLLNLDMLNEFIYISCAYSAHNRYFDL